MLTAKDVIRLTLDSSDMTLKYYLSDLEDADLLARPVPAMNHIAWQLGHVIDAERHFLEFVEPGSAPALPEGFGEAHGKGAAGSDDPRQFLTKARYLELWGEQRAATKRVLDALPEGRLGEPGPEPMRAIAPTVAGVFNLLGTHALMHAGQFVAVRRMLDKPVLF